MECGESSPLCVVSEQSGIAMMFGAWPAASRSSPLCVVSKQSGDESPRSIRCRVAERLGKSVGRLLGTGGEFMAEENLARTDKDWPHAPVHRLGTDGVYMVTAATLYKEHFFKAPAQLTLLENKLLTLAKQYQWQLEAWAVFANHYHFVARSLPRAVDLRQLIINLHADTARHLNRLEQVAGRAVWYNFWDTKLTYQYSYLARLNYVHQNAVKHGLVKVANQYPWCSAAWFERTATPAMVKTIYGFKTDQVKVLDDF